MKSLGAVLALGLVACAPTVTPQGQEFDVQSSAVQHDIGFTYNTAQATFREGLKSITQRYLEPIKMDVLAISGLQGLATIDPSLHLNFDAQSHKVELFRGETSLKQFKTPARANATAWAYLTTNVIRTARAHSQDMQDSSSERIFEAVFDGMMSNLDIFSRYAGGEEARAHRAQRDGFGGIGISVSKTHDSTMITKINHNSPASLAGLKVNDVIVQIEDTPVSERSNRSVLDLLHGPVGSLVSLSVVRRPKGQGADMRHIDFNLRRSHIVPDTVESDIKDAILTLRISSFNKSTSTSVHRTLRAHKHALRTGSIRGVILDLRGNPGGLLSQSVNVADLFLNKGRIISTRGRHLDSIHDYTAGGIDLTQGLPLVVLIDGNSASAAEIVASALQDLGRAVVVGSTSYGKGTVQTVIRLPNDGEMTLTWSRLISPSGYALHGLGVMPSVCATNLTSGLSESTFDAILAPTHIKKQQDAMTRWWATGLIFDGHRQDLRNACPAKIFKSTKTNDLLIQLAKRIIDDPGLYQYTLLKPNAVNTAARH